MRCPAAWRLAAAASGEDPEATGHAEGCARCAAVLADQGAVIAVARRLDPPVLRAAAQAELAAAIVASVEPPPRRSWWLAGGAAGLAVAAAIAVVATRTTAPEIPPAPAATLALPPPPATAVAHVEPPPPRPATIALREGKVAIDAPGPIDVVERGAVVAVASGRAELHARNGVFVMVRVFAGSVVLAERGKPIVIMSGDVWVRPQPKAPAEPASSLALFRTGWEALRDGREAAALAAFDRATDPVVREDALFWSAVAADRHGDRAGAARRLRAFLAEFPASPRAADARGLLAQLSRY